MKDEIYRIKRENPGIPMREAFKQAAGNWKLNKPLNKSLNKDVLINTVSIEEAADYGLDEENLKQ